MGDPPGDGPVAFEAYGLFFRQWRLEDTEVMVALFDTDQMNRWTPLASPFTRETAVAYVEAAWDARAAGTTQLAVTLTRGGPPVGEVIVFPAAEPDEVELAYAVGAHHQGKAVGRRAVLGALELAQSQGAQRAVLKIAERNAASAAVARAAGFVETDAPLLERQRKGFVLRLRTWTRDL